MHNISIRPATISDIEAIFGYNKRHGRTYLPLDKTDEMLREIICENTNSVLVAVCSGHIAGYIYSKEITSLTEPRYVEIINLNVSKYYREFGVENELLRATRQWAEQLSASKIVFTAKIYDLDRYSELEAENYSIDRQSVSFLKKL